MYKKILMMPPTDYCIWVLLSDNTFFAFRKYMFTRVAKKKNIRNKIYFDTFGTFSFHRESEQEKRT